jgi:hypothetical protein
VTTSVCRVRLLPWFVTGSIAPVLAGCVAGADAVPADAGRSAPDVPASHDAGSAPDAPGTPDAVPPIVTELEVCASGAPYSRIGDAIAAAPPEGATIRVCAGTYAERLTIDGKSLRIVGTGGADVTILDAAATGGAVSIQNAGGAGVTIEGLTIRNGVAATEGGGLRCAASTLHLLGSVLVDNRGQGGGGLAALGCVVDVSGTRFEHNRGGEQGGGALFVDASGMVSASEFLGNTAVGGSVTLVDNDLRANFAELRGGALFHDSDSRISGNTIADNDSGWIGGGILVTGHAPMVAGNTVSGNTSVNDGAGIYVDQGAATLLENHVLLNESGDDGGGIRVFESAALVQGNVVERNRCVDAGGGIRVSHLPGLFIDNVVRDNVATNTGGGYDLDNSSSVVRGGVISGNSASSGGGIFAMTGPWNGGLIEGITITDNHAWLGGGIHLSQNFQPYALRDLTIAGNHADQGAGIYVRATGFTLQSSRVWGNAATRGGGLFFGASEPWTTDCPCPPSDPTGAVAFTVFHGNDATEGSAIWTESLELSVESSILTDNRTMQVTVAAAPPATGSMLWRYNDTLPATFAGMAVPSGSDGNLAVDPRFAGAGAGDFHLLAGSPCIDAADPAFFDPDGTRADMGAFGGAP